ncbi:chalcone isomerase family protein [Shewanella sp. NIFS-20-20]|uniref:chalcone isomerase family protein n=1 Tax=Shewanella sp. NIFS-20-20 TaxID=2853806 RepID=UPI001C4833EA|nr:chalcone isomerase family protein [Shewanella sp. NIFS-20-20]MBV7314514.1 chalcone isomerase family protein [Shewanella sp. NIFS-20-20]
MARLWLLAALASVLMALGPRASAQAQEPADDKSWQVVGRTQMSVMWFDIYRATLTNPSGEYQAFTPPLKLEIEYQRDISAADLVSATDEQWQHLGVFNDYRQAWVQQLQGLWPDVSEGDRLALMWYADGSSQFYFNDQAIGSRLAAQFGHCFLAIWLSQHTSHPQRRLELIGETSCDC